MKKSMVFMGVILGLFLNAFPWPESQAGATQSSSVLVFKGNTFKSFSHPSTGGGKYLTFEALVAGTLDDYKDGVYTSFIVEVSNMSLASTILLAYNTGSKFKIDYTRDPDFMSRPVMVTKVFTLQE